MVKIALTGGIACGKSLVGRYLREAGVETIDADDVVHEIIPDPAERRRIAAEVFNDPAKRRELEAKIHPMVMERIDKFFSPSPSPSPSTFVTAAPPPPSSPSPSPSPLRLAIIPLLFEVHWETNYGIICAVVSKRETQIERMMTTRGYTREEAEARLAAQMPVEVKAKKSHYVIENDGTAEELKVKVLEFVRYLQNHK